MSDFSELSVALTGLEAEQVGMDTVGQNVANANTAGYVEESVQLGTLGPFAEEGITGVNSQPGDGVQVEGISRLTNTYLQSQSYTQQGLQGSLSAQQTGLQSVQENFPEPAGNGISSELTQYWQDWSNLANNPSDSSAQTTVVQDGSTLAESLNQTSNSLTALSNQTVQNITSTLSTVNQEASQIANLNQSILATNAGTNASSDGSIAALEDQRDELVSQLSSQLGVQVSYNQDGTVNVYSGTESLVSGPNYQQLSLSSSGPPYSLVWSNDQSTYQPSSGQLAGMLDVVNNYVPSYQSSLDQVAQSLMGSVNYLMSTGYDQAGNQGAPFFLGTGASNIEVNPALVSNPDLIGANASATPSGSDATNEDGTVAAEVGELPNSQTATMLVPAGGWSAGGSASSWTSGATTTTGTEADAAYNELVTTVGQQTSSVNNQLTDQQTVTTNVNSALQSATGVNTDQELTNMVMYQNAYEATAKFMSTVDTLLQSLITMVNS
ncbi:MAG TPA: flagellar hook-associated protein FlgK [Acidimicrobiales bacterium]|nr:flagellar hook-associated protein FlgK [Acidimicrobiales bacterium]